MGADDPAGSHEVTAACSLTTAKPAATVTPKVDAPSIDKKIVEGESRVDASTASIGDSVEYEITSKVPSMQGYNLLKGPIKLVITADAALDKCTWTVTANGDKLSAGCRRRDPARDQKAHGQDRGLNIRSKKIRCAATASKRSRRSKPPVWSPTASRSSLCSSRLSRRCPCCWRCCSFCCCLAAGAPAETTETIQTRTPEAFS